MRHIAVHSLSGTNKWLLIYAAAPWIVYYAFLAWPGAEASAARTACLWSYVILPVLHYFVPDLGDRFIRDRLGSTWDDAWGAAADHANAERRASRLPPYVLGPAIPISFFYFIGFNTLFVTMTAVAVVSAAFAFIMKRILKDPVPWIAIFICSLFQLGLGFVAFETMGMCEDYCGWLPLVLT